MGHTGQTFFGWFGPMSISCWKEMARTYLGFWYIHALYCTSEFLLLSLSVIFCQFSCYFSLSKLWHFFSCRWSSASPRAVCCSGPGPARKRCTTWCWAAGSESPTWDSTSRRSTACSWTWPRPRRFTWTYWDELWTVCMCVCEAGVCLHVCVELWMDFAVQDVKLSSNTYRQSSKCILSNFRSFVHLCSLPSFLSSKDIYREYFNFGGKKHLPLSNAFKWLGLRINEAWLAGQRIWRLPSPCRYSPNEGKISGSFCL